MRNFRVQIYAGLLLAAATASAPLAQAQPTAQAAATNTALVTQARRDPGGLTPSQGRAPFPFLG